MNIFYVVIIAVGLLLIVISIYARENANRKGQESTGKPKPSKQINGTSRPVESLSTNDAREWLDDFLVKQQSDTKKDDTVT